MSTCPPRDIPMNQAIQQPGSLRIRPLLLLCLLMRGLEEAHSHDGFGGEGDFGNHAGGGAFGSGGFAGGDNQRYGGSGSGDGHFGGGGLGSVRGSGSDNGAAHDWAERTEPGREPKNDQNGPKDESTRQQDLHQLEHQNEAYRYYNQSSYTYYGGSWGGFYSGMMMGEMTGMMVGASMASLPRQYSTITAGGTPYYYSNGAYLVQQQGHAGYTLVPPPPGAVVAYLPSSCTPVYRGQETFYDCGGAFYQSVSGGYQVVIPPPGIQINNIPSGAVAKQINNTPYLEYGGVWYQPFYGGSDVIYRVVGNPSP